MFAVCDDLIAAKNAVVGQSYGTGSCYIGDIMKNVVEQREIIDLPRFILPVAMVVFEYPTKQQMYQKKPRSVDSKYIVHTD